MVLYAATSAPDTDFVARLTDVYPDGRSINITEGVIRARFREDVWGRPRLLEPGRVYEFTIDLQVTSTLFLAGHRLRLDITSSNFPLWDRNLNTGHDPATDTTMAVAEQSIHHSGAYPSAYRAAGRERWPRLTFAPSTAQHRDLRIVLRRSDLVPHGRQPRCPDLGEEIAGRGLHPADGDPESYPGYPEHPCRFPAAYSRNIDQGFDLGDHLLDGVVVLDG